MLWRAPVIGRGPGHPACPVAGDPGPQPGIVLSDQPPLELVVLLQPAPTLAQPRPAVTRDRGGVSLAFGIKGLLGLAQPLAAIALNTKLDRQLIAACVPMLGVLRGIG